jgi:hypothetical protein
MYGCVLKLVYMHVRMSMCLDLDEPLQNIWTYEWHKLKSVGSCHAYLDICLFSELRHAIVYARLVYIHKALWSTIWKLFTRTPQKKNNELHICWKLGAHNVDPEKGHNTYNLRNIETRYSLVVLKFVYRLCIATKFSRCIIFMIVATV